MTKEQILDYLSEHKAEFREKYRVNRIGLFGSFAKGTANEESDIDLLVDMPSDLDRFYDLKERLEAQLSKKVDLGYESALRELVRRQIQDETIYV
ncbi:MAG: nucleotidyltransferase family protein [Campylobacterales bacterium]